jgi:hypothetical protein
MLSQLDARRGVVLDVGDTPQPVRRALIFIDEHAGDPITLEGHARQNSSSSQRRVQQQKPAIARAGSPRRRPSLMPTASGSAVIPISTCISRRSTSRPLRGVAELGQLQNH